MKRYNHIRVVLNVYAALQICVLLNACTTSDESSAEEKASKLLQSGTWQISLVTYDDTDVTNAFSNMTLSFSKKTFTSSQGDPVWETSGLWDFTDDTANAFKRDDDVVVSIELLDETHLILKLDWTTDYLNEGKLNSVNGEYVFEFTR